MSNHYQTLGVQPSASIDEIKSAYRKLAKQYHPDVNPGFLAAFQEMSEAYNVLVDPKKREDYDYTNGFKAKPRRSKSTVDDFFSRYNSRSSNPFRRETVFDYASIFDQEYSRYQNRQEIRAVVKVPIEKAYTGGVFMVKGIDSQPIPIKVRPKSVPGTVMDVTTKTGTVRVTIEIIDSERFKMSGNDIEAIHSISLKDAIMGNEIEVLNPANEKYKLKIPPGTKSGTVFNLKKEGLGGNNLRIKIEVEIPQCLTKEDLSSFKRDVYDW